MPEASAQVAAVPAPAAAPDAPAVAPPAAPPPAPAKPAWTRDVDALHVAVDGHEQAFEAEQAPDESHAAALSRRRTAAWAIYKAMTDLAQVHYNRAVPPDSGL